MNLASLLSLPVAPTPATSAQAPAAAPDTALPEGFAALLGMVAAPAEEAAAALPEAGNAAAKGGKILPVPASLVLSLPVEPAGNAPAIEQAAQPAELSLSLVPALAAIPLPLPVAVPSMPDLPAKSAVPSTLLPAPVASLAGADPASAAPADTGLAGQGGEATGTTPRPTVRPALQLQVEVRPLAASPASPNAGAAAVPASATVIPTIPAATASAPVPQPSTLAAAAAPAVLAPVAQQAVQGTAERRQDASRAATTPVHAAARADATAEAKPASAAPLPPVAAPAIVTPQVADLMRPAAVEPGQAQPTPPAAAAPDRHDFAAIVDRLAQARELARPGQATMQLATREFGLVSVQFDMAGPALKVALSSADAAFAPAVQAALAERPILAPVPAQAEAQPQRADPRQDAGPGASNAGNGAAVQQDGQRHDTPSRGQSARTTGEHVQRQPQEARQDDPAAATRSDRDGSRFA